MKITRTIILAAEGAQLRARFENHMLRSGYRGEAGEFSRGSPLRNWFTWNPRDWHARVSLRTHALLNGQTQADLELDVTTSGRWVTQNERAYWEAEADALQMTLEMDGFQGAHLPWLARKVAGRNSYALVFLLIGLILGSCPIFAITEKVGPSLAGFAIGGLVFGALGQVFIRAKMDLSVPKRMVPLPGAAPVRDVQEMFRRDLRGWGGWLILSGVLAQFAAGSLSAPWGIAQILVGLGSFVFRTPALHVIYAVMMLWAAVSNTLLSGSGAWTVFGIIQVFWMVMVVINFRRYNRAYQAGAATALAPAAPVPTPATLGATPGEDGRWITPPPLEALPPDPRAGWISWIALGLGGLGLPALVVIFVMEMFTPAGSPMIDTLGFLFEVAFNLCILGYAAGLGALLARHPYRAAAILGMIAGGVGVLAVILLFILSSTGGAGGGQVMEGLISSRFA